MKAVSVMFSLVIDQSCAKVEVEAEVTYEDGTTRMTRLPASRALRIDLDSFYAEATNASAS